MKNEQDEAEREKEKDKADEDDDEDLDDEAGEAAPVVRILLDFLSIQFT